MSRKTTIRFAIEAAVIRIASSAGMYPTRLTREPQLSALIRALHPVAPGMELIRLGPEQDGGYLVPNDLEGIEACFSPGVSRKSDFEKDCAERGMQVFLADKTVDAPALAHERFVFTKKNVGAVPSADCMTMDEWADSALPNPTPDLILQMDIEGAEYETLLGMSDVLLRRFRILVIEFHMLDKLWSAPFFRVTAPVFAKILQQHMCVHLHPNNCCGTITRGGITVPRTMEFTFLRNDRLKATAFATRFPHPLDRDNTPRRSIVLPRCWYQS